MSGNHSTSNGPDAGLYAISNGIRLLERRLYPSNARNHMIKLDEMVRTRLRIVLWKQWKGITGRARNLMKLGIAKARAYQLANTRKAYCRTANSPTLLTTLNNAYFSKLGLQGFANYYYWKTTHQTKLF